MNAARSVDIIPAKLVTMELQYFMWPTPLTTTLQGYH